MAELNDHRDHRVTAIKNQQSRQRSRLNTAHDGVSRTLEWLRERRTQLEDLLLDIVPRWRRYHITRRMEIVLMTVLFAAELVVAIEVIQVFGLSMSETVAVAIAVALAATGIAFHWGHERAVEEDPHAAAAGHDANVRLALQMVIGFLAANCGVRIYYGIIANAAAGLGGGVVLPILEGVLLTIVTAALMLAASFVTENAETSHEVEVRKELKQVTAEIERRERIVTKLGEHGAHGNAVDKEGPEPTSVAQ